MRVTLLAAGFVIGACVVSVGCVWVCGGGRACVRAVLLLSVHA